jgi:hypothetical protein
MSADRSLPPWAQRLIELRRSRAWSPADLAAELKKRRDGLPSVRSLAHMIQLDWETGKHRPGEGVRVLLGAGGFEPHPPRSGGSVIDTYPWGAALDEVDRLAASASAESVTTARLG